MVVITVVRWLDQQLQLLLMIVVAVATLCNQRIGTDFTSYQPRTILPTYNWAVSTITSCFDSNGSTKQVSHWFYRHWWSCFADLGLWKQSRKGMLKVPPFPTFRNAKVSESSNLKSLSNLANLRPLSFVSSKVSEIWDPSTRWEPSAAGLALSWGLILGRSAESPDLRPQSADPAKVAGGVS